MDNFNFTPINLCNAFQNFATKSMSLSHIISEGKPFSQYQWSIKITANSYAVMFVRLVAIICISGPSLSVIVNIQSAPSSSGKGPMKSILPW